MEDCCAVCAEPLEWVAYGPCGHRDVCSTCIARLRIVLDDKRCCICKQECELVFVTKALGDYTKVVADFSSLASRVPGDLWFDAEVGAYFDDEDEFKRIKAMCKLQCRVCETSDNPSNGYVKKGFVFKSLDALRRHIYALHRLTMCELCLEGRKVFIQDQKLYTRAQLERHSRGESKVDGTEEGFSGHPMCVFCNRRFYGDNELYHHMSTEHFTCHICRRSKPTEFDYYKNYDDLEAHFRNEHVLCEHPECLAKKFIVFSTEGELKVHNAKEHGGTLSRAQRNAAMQIPLTHTFRRGQSSQDSRHGSYYRQRERDLNAELFSAMRDSLETAAMEETLRESDAAGGPSMNPESFPALGHSSSTTDVESTAAEADRRYRVAVHGPGSTLNVHSAFPPLPGAAASASQPPGPAGPARSMAALFGSKGRGSVKVLHASERRQTPPTQASTAVRISDFPDLVASAGHSATSVSGRGPPPGPRGPLPGSRAEPARGPAAVSSSSSQPTSSISTRSAPVSTARQQAPATWNAASSSGSSSSSSSSLPLNMDEIRAATKVLIDDIRSRLKGDEEQFAEFKQVQSEFKQGKLTARTYYDRVSRLGLTVIIPELARLCPDPAKQQELRMVMREQETTRLAKAENRTTRQLDDKPPEVLSHDGYRRAKPQQDSLYSNSSSSAPAGSSSSGPAESLSSNQRAADLRLPQHLHSSSWACETCTLLNPADSAQCAACGSARHKAEDPSSSKKKKKKKVSKFNRMRLGTDAVEDEEEEVSDPVNADCPAARGVWRNGGGQRLVSRAG